MKNILCLLAFFATFSAFAQKTLELTNIESGKVKIYEENQRIKVRTLDGKKHVGLLHFSNDGEILVDKFPIKPDNILSIKSQPKVLGTIKTVVLVAGLAIVGSSIVVAAAGGEAAFMLFTVGGGVTITAGIIEAFNTNNSNRKWTFKIIYK
ncbi:hypothetical protein [Flavobacterium sp. 3HN19-14]|uniref:hypothetical protein n=1 Tax=Flavobacterium sp. 3HN19-14 TaxID=3448133 RepID=UPI003EE02240